MLVAKPQLDDITARSLVVEVLVQLFVEEYDLLGAVSKRRFPRSLHVTSLTAAPAIRSALGTLER